MPGHACFYFIPPENIGVMKWQHWPEMIKTLNRKTVYSSKYTPQIMFQSFQTNVIIR